MQARIADVLSQKGRRVYCVQPGATVGAAVDTMARFNVGALVVLSEQRRVVGLLSERDVLWRIVHENRPQDTLVREIMTERPVSISQDNRVSEAMQIMTERRIRHLPVIDALGELQGLISIGDLTKWVTRDLETHLGELAGYICGTSFVEVQTLF
jgi:CBS domain-containing protein